MADKNQIKNKILSLAESDERIRAVLLKGSRANPNVTPDKYQDYDIVFIVKNSNSFLSGRSWFDALGKLFLQQLPDEMILENEEKECKVSFTFLTIFEDRNRIDLTLFPLEKFESDFQPDSLTKVWLDKDCLFKDIPQTSDKDYHITKPNQQAFSDVCNEFWWTVTYVAKGLKRNQIIYAKDTMETVVRPMFLKMLEWKAASDNDFKIDTGKSGKFLNVFLDGELFKQVLKTYADSDPENNWNALFLMAEIFRELQNSLAEKLKFEMKSIEAGNSLKYIKEIYGE